MRLLNFMMKPLMWHVKKRGILTMGWVCNTNESF